MLGVRADGDARDLIPAIDILIENRRIEVCQCSNYYRFVIVGEGVSHYGRVDAPSSH